MVALAVKHGPSLRILVTGAAGLIGSELCGQLADRGHSIIALVHRTRYLVRRNGDAILPAAHSGTAPLPGTVVSVAGDVREPGLGLGPAPARALANAVDLVVHCAAEIGFGGGPDPHRRVNIEGTTKVVAFLRQTRRAPGRVYVSAAYVCGGRSGWIAEEELKPAPPFANPYEASKAAAEALVAASGLRAAIVRPSIVVGTSNDGRISRFENVYGLLRLIGEGRIRTLPVAPGATLDLVPIDHVVAGLVDIEARGLRALSARLCPPTGPAFLRRVIDYAVSAGYITRIPDLLNRRVPHLISG